MPTPRGRRPVWVPAVVLPCLIAGLSGVLVVAGTGTLEILPRIAGGVVGAIAGLLVGVGAGDELCAALRPIKLQVDKRWAQTRPHGPGAVAVLVVSRSCCAP